MIWCTVDHAYFVKELEDGSYLLISLAIDDLLVSCRNYRIFDDLVTYLKQYFDLTVQSGQVLKCFGLRIIKLDTCLFIDQAEYTFGILEHCFGATVD